MCLVIKRFNVGLSEIVRLYECPVVFEEYQQKVSVLGKNDNSNNIIIFYFNYIRGGMDYLHRNPNSFQIFSSCHTYSRCSHRNQPVDLRSPINQQFFHMSYKNTERIKSQLKL